AAESYIDVGARSANEVEAMGIRVGDPIVLIAPLTRLTHNPDLVLGRAIDNRIGCALIIRTFLDQVLIPAGTLVGIFTVQEEVGLRGARVAARELDLDFTIVLDTMPASGTPDMNPETELNVVIGSGPTFK